MEDILYTVTMGALCHDIGKLIYRAQGARETHSELGAEFLQDEQIALPGKASILEIVRFHHHQELARADLPDSHPAYIVYEADNIAAAADRRLNEGMDSGFDASQPLHTVFNIVGGQRPEDKASYRAATLRDEDGIAYPDSSVRALTPGDYSRLLEHLRRNLQQIKFQIEHPNTFLKVLESVTSYIPSSTSQEELPDVSLYDHLKLTAAVAACIYQYLTEQNRVNFKQELFSAEGRQRFREEEAFLMVSADISGIQDFIYTITTRAALKSLRARSFYLDLLLEHCADEILDALDLTRANLLYLGGGHFYMLLPNTRQAREVIAQARREFNRWLYKYYSTSLYIEIAAVPVSAGVLTNGDEQGSRENRLGGAYQSLAEQLNLGKMRRFAHDNIEEMLNAEITMQSDIDAGRECGICRTSSIELVDDVLDTGETQVICRNCDALRDMGGQLGRGWSRNDELIMAVAGTQPENKKYMELPVLGSAPAFLYVSNRQEAEKQLQQDIKAFWRLYSINTPMTGVAMSTNLWMGAYSKPPQSGEKRYVDFEELVSDAIGIKRLAVLRADVDNLGTVFARGLEQPDSPNPFRYISLSRSAALSRQLSLFFKRDINFLCAERNCQDLNPYASKQTPRSLAVVYSGGDDLFVVGAWNEVIEFAVDLWEAFRRFTCGKLHFSAGIGFFRNGFPISQMAALTAVLEESAKDMDGKNAVALFGLDRSIRSPGEAPRAKHCYKWEVFANKILKDKLVFLNSCLAGEDEKENEEKLDIGVASLYRWLHLFENLNDEDGRINLARLAYNLARMEPPDRAPEKKKKAYQELRDKIYKWALDDRERQELVTAINLYIYQHRKAREDEEDGR